MGFSQEDLDTTVVVRMEENNKKEDTRAGCDRKISLPVLNCTNQRSMSTRRSSLVTESTKIRKSSFVSFDEKTATIEIVEKESIEEEEDKENDDLTGGLEEAKYEDEDVPVMFCRKKIQDSIKIKRK